MSKQKTGSAPKLGQSRVDINRAWTDFSASDHLIISKHSITQSWPIQWMCSTGLI